MDLGVLLPSLQSVYVLVFYFVYLAVAGEILPGKVIRGVLLSDGSQLRYRCNGLLALILLVAILGICAKLGIVSPLVVADRGLELLSATFIFCVLVTLALYVTGRSSSNKGSSLKPHVSGNLVHDWWFGIQLNPQFMSIDLKAGMMGWLLINLSILAKSVQDGSLSQSMILYQIFCAGWWLLHNKVELTVPAIVVNCLVFLIGYMVFRGANKQKHIFKKNPKTPIWGKPPVVVGGKLLVSGYWGIARHCNYLGDLMLALSFSLPCGISSPVPYFYPIYLLILLIWRERRDEVRCAEKYKEIWAEYLRLVPWRILPYVY
nr:nuclear envelope membrane protein-like - Arabidopsis thaliana [Arabidopsis thaliana]